MKPTDWRIQALLDRFDAANLREDSTASRIKDPALTDSRGGCHYHGPRRLNGRVRDGNGCGPPGVRTGMLLERSAVSSQRSAKRGWPPTTLDING